MTDQLLTKENLLRIGESAGAGLVGGAMGAVPKGIASGMKQAPLVNDESGLDDTIPDPGEENAPDEAPQKENAFNVMARDTKAELGLIKDKAVENINAFSQAGQKVEHTEVEQVEPQPGSHEPVEPDYPSEIEINRNVNQSEIDRLDELERIAETVEDLGVGREPTGAEL